VTIESIADSAHGAHDVLERLKFGAKSPDVDIDSATVGAVDVARSPQGVNHARAINGDSFAEDEVLQQFKLFIGQWSYITVDDDSFCATGRLSRPGSRRQVSEEAIRQQPAARARQAARCRGSYLVDFPERRRPRCEIPCQEPTT